MAEPCAFSCAFWSGASARSSRRVALSPSRTWLFGNSSRPAPEPRSGPGSSPGRGGSGRRCRRSGEHIAFIRHTQLAEHHGRACWADKSARCAEATGSVPARAQSGPSASPWPGRSPMLLCPFQARHRVFAEYGVRSRANMARWRMMPSNECRPNEFLRSPTETWRCGRGVGEPQELGAGRLGQKRDQTRRILAQVRRFACTPTALWAEVARAAPRR